MREKDAQEDAQDAPTSDPLAPSSMTPGDRLREVAALLARGYLRLRSPTAPPPDALSPRSPQKDLEQPGDQAPPCAPGERPPRGRARKEEPA